MLGAPSGKKEDSTVSVIPAQDFSKYTGTYRNGSNTLQIVEQGGKLLLGGAEIRRVPDGWLVSQNPDSNTPSRVFPVAGPDGRIEYLDSGGRALARATVNAAGSR